MCRRLAATTTGLTMRLIQGLTELVGVGHVVVVDDDPAFREMMTGYLEDHNVPARSASNKAELTRHLERLRPSLIILDIRLGSEDGLDVLRELRSHSDVPVIITTGHRSDEADRVVCFELGADDYIAKPIFDRSIDVQVLRLRRKLEINPGAPRVIQTERGIGYVFALPVERY